MTLAAGQMLTDNLELERELGAGGMGSVWLARNHALGSHVAVKILRRVQDVDLSLQRARFEQEARGLARLDHPHLVKIFDFGITMDGDPFIVMELLAGADLADRLRRERTMSPRDVAMVVSQACRALAKVHEAGVVHRDIKPANLFLVEADGEIFVKLLDFGIAKFTLGGMNMTKGGELLGTPYYMSPEQFATNGTVDARSDLWALAVVVYLALTGRLPFEKENLAALGMAISLGQFVPLKDRRPDLPGAVNDWMSRALSIDPAARFPTARELAAAFAAALEGVSDGIANVTQPGAGAGAGPSTVADAEADTVAMPGPLNAPEQAPPSEAVASRTNPMTSTRAATAVAPASGGSKTLAAIAGVFVLVAIAIAGTWAFANRARSDASLAPEVTASPSASSALVVAPAEDVVSSTVAPRPSTAQTPNTPVSVAPDASGATAVAPPASVPGPPKRSTSGPSGVVQHCWKNNEGDEAGAPQTSVRVEVFVTELGKGTSVKITGAGSSYKGMVGCSVSRLAAHPYGQGPAETLAFTVTLPAKK